jgi:hypothetical protein
MRLIGLAGALRVVVALAVAAGVGAFGGGLEPDARSGAAAELR